MEIELGAAAFWISVAAVLIAGGYFSARKEAAKLDAIARLAQQSGKLDEEQIKLLFPRPPALPPQVYCPPQPDGRRALKVFGTIVLSAAVGLALFFTILYFAGTPEQQQSAIVGYASTALIACVGVGLIVASRFIRPPPSQAGGDENR